ncbi:MAG: nucleoside 2-deoxyribosyltransferase domain-containing protein [Candidatus Microsaccharimonas sp.]
MAERITLQPPEIVEATEPVIFLAGPIQGAPDWQTTAARLIHDIDPAITVASPRRNYPDGTFVYEKQVDWETHFLRTAGRSGVVAFWLAAQAEETPGRSYAQTTRFELAEWKIKHERDGAKLTIGIEEGFGNARYIRRRFAQDAPSVEIVDTLEEMTRNAVDLARSRN